MMKNNKGMTLIEVVLAIAILATASIAMGSGFLVANDLMKQSAIYTKAVKSEESALKGGSGAESTTTVTEQNKQSMSFTTGNSTLTSSGIVATASDTRLGKLSLSQYFESDTAARDETTDNFYKKITNDLYIFLNDNFSSNNERKAYIRSKYGITSVTGSFNNVSGNLFVSNLTMQKLVYSTLCKGTSFPSLDTNIIAKCDEIYDKTHSNQTSSWTGEYQAKLSRQASSYYINVFWIDSASQNDSNVDNCLILYATPNSNVLDTTNTSLIYNFSDGHWYYKIFPSNGSSYNSYVNILAKSVLYGSSTVTNIQNELKDTTNWTKIVLD